MRVANLKIKPESPVLIDGWTRPHEGESYMKDFVEHGMNVWPGDIKKEEMDKWGIRQVRLSAWSADKAQQFVEHVKSLGLNYNDYFVGVLDEPGGKTETELKPFIDICKKR